jgi:hypothetical protein
MKTTKSRSATLLARTRCRPSRPLKLGVALVVAALGTHEPTAMAVVAAAPDAPEPQPASAAAAAPGVIPTMGTQIGKDGSCVATTDRFSPTDYASTQSAAHAACLDTLIPSRPVPVLQTPGSFFAGYAWGKSNQWIYGPQVGLGAALLIPLHRPSLKLTAITAGPGAQVPEGSQFTYTLPPAMTFASSLAVSLNANLAAFSFPNAPSSVTSSGTTQTAFNAGFYLAPQFGWEWWNGTAQSVMFSIGVVAGYINTVATGSAFALGIQPGIVAQF